MGKLTPSAKPSMMSASKNAGLRNLGRKKSDQASMLYKKLDLGGDAGIDPNTLAMLQQQNSKASAINGADVKGLNASQGPSSGVSTSGAVGAFGAAADMSSQVIDVAAPANVYGVKSNGAAEAQGALKGAAKGAAAGMAFGPWGAVVGGVIGGTVGLIGGKSANDKAAAAQHASFVKQEGRDDKALTDQSNNRLATNPNLVTGSSQRTLYAAKGGLLKTNPITAAFPDTKNMGFIDNGQRQPARIPGSDDKTAARKILTRMDLGGTPPSTPTKPASTTDAYGTTSTPLSLTGSVNQGYQSGWKSEFEGPGAISRMKYQQSVDGAYDPSAHLTAPQPGTYEYGQSKGFTAEQQIAQRKANVNSVLPNMHSVTYAEQPKTATSQFASPNQRGAEYTPATNSLDVFPDNAKKYGLSPLSQSGVMAHELIAHGGDKNASPYGTKFGAMVQQHMSPSDGTPLSNEIRIPDETHARAVAWRSMAGQSGVHDSSKGEASPQDFHKVYTNSALNKDIQVQQLKSNTAGKTPAEREENARWLYNHASTNQPSNTTMARKGGLLKLADGGITPVAGNLANKKSLGGDLQPLSKHTSMVKGPSHESGGVKIPGAGAEVEGGETTSGNFVFSKELGFADAHKPIATALGKAEKKPDNMVNTNTIRILKEKEAQLAQAQEQTKQQAGIPNDLPSVGAPQTGAEATGQEPQQARKGGMLSKKAPQAMFANNQGNQIMADGGKVKSSDPSLASYNSNHFPGNALRSIQENLSLDGGARAQNAEYDGKVHQNYMSENPNITPAKGIVYDALKQPKAPSPLVTKAKGGMLKKYDGGGTVPTWDETFANTTNGNSLPPVVPQVPFAGAYQPNGDLAPMQSFNPLASRSASMGEVAASPIAGGNTGTPQAPGMWGKLKAGIPGALDGAGKAFDAATPFMADLYNLKRQLPNAPVYQEQNHITPQLVNYAASRQEAQSQGRAASLAATKGLSSGAEIAAVNAANAANTTSSINRVNEAENNQNASIKNNAISENSRIDANNLQLRNTTLNNQIEKANAQQNLKANSLAAIGTKIQQAHKEQNEKMGEADKLMLQMSTDQNGVSERNFGPLYDRFLKEGKISKKDREDYRTEGIEGDKKRKEERLAQLKALTYTGLSSNKGEGGTNSPRSNMGPSRTKETFKNGQEVEETRTSR